MENITTYNIAFTGLSQDLHHFEYVIQDSFFALFKDSPIQKGHIVVDLDFNKHNSFFELDFSFYGNVRSSCDRCLGDFSFPINTNQKVIVKLKPGIEDIIDENDILYIPESETQLNIAQLIYEYITLSLGNKKIYCEITGNMDCDQNMIKILNKNEVTTN